MQVSIDTSLLIAIERGDRQAIAAFKSWHAKGWTGFVCSVALAEWLQGAHAVKDPVKKARADRFYDQHLSTLPVRSLSEQDAVVFGKTVGALRAHGKAVGFADGLIGCQALQYGVPVATYNVADFSVIPGLEIIDPNEKAPDVEDAKGQEG
ncbi:MAG: PIN domain-containing protein [Verrucomicrobiota bacterium]|jgi:predicted nucleic acid-binding protein